MLIVSNYMRMDFRDIQAKASSARSLDAREPKRNKKSTSQLAHASIDSGGQANE